MSERSTLMVGVKLKELSTKEMVYQNVTVLHSDSIGIVFEVQRTISEGGTIETVVSQILIPWVKVDHIVLMEERT
jgi:hypothetical protein